MEAPPRRRKRSRREADNESADCPFTIESAEPDVRQPKGKKRRKSIAADPPPEDRSHVQLSPFSPSGKFRAHENLDIRYNIKPRDPWYDMTRYNSFVLNGLRYHSEGFVFVANRTSVARLKSEAAEEHEHEDDEDGADADDEDDLPADELPRKPLRKAVDDWVARILEIRARDEQHVYARVYWMYWPDELPPATLDGKKTPAGRQPYHGTNELIASNHMDIINVVSVTAPATVSQWIEENDDEIQDALYWRQALDLRTFELSTVERVCKCGAPGNPDKILIGCTTEPCKQWLHEWCLKHEALMDVYRKLGTDRPYVPGSNGTHAKGNAVASTRPLSPTETSGKPSINVNPNAAIAQSLETVHVKREDEGDFVNGNVEHARPLPRDMSPTSPTSDNQTYSDAVSLRQQTGSPSSPSTSAPARVGMPNYVSMSPMEEHPPTRKPGRPRKRANSSVPPAGATRSSFNPRHRPYLGLFEVNLRIDLNPPQLEFKDLRSNISGGEKTWLQDIHCLVCGSTIN